MGSDWQGECPISGRGAGGAVAITHGNPWRTSCWWLSEWLFGSGAGGASGVDSGCWGLPGKSWGCVMAGSCRVTWDCHSMGTQQEKLTETASRVNFHPMGPGIKIGDDVWRSITCPMSLVGGLYFNQHIPAATVSGFG